MTKESGVVQRAAELIEQADALLIGAGAGMGVDSGLPDFRGNEGFWRAYPPFAKLGLGFTDLASPEWFERDRALAWGFYGHRLNLYRRVEPHAGFASLLKWSKDKDGGAFVFTSNVDGHFQRAGFNERNIVECHGSIHHLQCVHRCSGDIWRGDRVRVEVDETTFRALPPLPSCRGCGGLARPNILMFGDWGWLGNRTADQERRFQSWLSSVEGMRLAVVECGAGTAVSTVRGLCQRAAGALGATLIRINLRESEGPPGTISIAAGALEALSSIDALL